MYLKHYFNEKGERVYTFKVNFSVDSFLLGYFEIQILFEWWMRSFGF